MHELKNELSNQIFTLEQ